MRSDRHSWKRRALVAMALMFAHALAAAAPPNLSIRDYQVTTWTGKDGAPATTWVMAQTGDGWLWFGGPGGLARFDGVRFEAIASYAGARLRSTAVSSLFATRSGELLIGSPAGDISVLKDGRLEVYASGQTSRAGRIEDFAEDAEGRLWAVGWEGVLRFDGHDWQAVGADRGVTAGAALGIVLDDAGTLWLLTRNDLLFLERGTQAFKRAAATAPTYGGIAEAPDGGVWLVDLDRGMKLVRAPSTTRIDRDRRGSKSSSHTFFDREGNVWQGYDHGALDWPGPVVTDLVSFDRDTTSGLQDRDGNIWFGGGAGRIHRFRRGLTTKALDLAGGPIGLVADGSGAIWAGLRGTFPSGNAGLWSFDGPARHVVPERLKTVAALARDADGTLWIGSTEAGLSTWRDGRVSSGPPLPDEARGQNVIGITPDCAGGLWVSVESMGLVRLAGNAWQRNGGVRELPSETPTVHACDAQRRLWLGYADGRMARITGDRVEFFGVDQGLRIGAVTSLSAVGHRVVVGGERGLALFGDGRFDTLKVDHPEALERATGIVQTHAGDLWINNMLGLAGITASELDQGRASGWKTAAAMRQIDVSDGYSRAGFAAYQATPTIAIGGDGRVWFASRSGIAWFDPARLPQARGAPPVFIQAVSTGSTRFEPAQGATLPKGTRSLQVDYTALDYTDPERLVFRYRLAGVDGDWVEAGMRRQAFYTNLGPGHFVFQVAVKAENGAWSDGTTSVAFDIPPTFVQTRAFVAACIAFAAALLVLLYRARVRQLTSRERMLGETRLKERERIARDLHDTLLQATQALVYKLHAALKRIPETSPDRPGLVDALDVAEGTLDEGRHRIGDLRAFSAHEADLAEALAEAGAELADGANVAFRIVVEGRERKLKPDVADGAYLIGREAMANAFRHARAQSIEVVVNYADDFLRVRILDDGVGIDETSIQGGARSGHWGMVGMRERAEDIAGVVETWSGAGDGTEVELRVPGTRAYLGKAPAWGLIDRARAVMRSLRPDP